MDENLPQNEVDINQSVQQNGCKETGAQENKGTTAREITQTDHLNRKLLESFLTRINSTNLAHLVERTNIDDQPSQSFEDEDEIEQVSTTEPTQNIENQQVKDWNLWRVHHKYNLQ